MANLEAFYGAHEANVHRPMLQGKNSIGRENVHSRRLESINLHDRKFTFRPESSLEGRGFAYPRSTYVSH